MAKRHSSFDYETLVRFMLPNGILDYFEITKTDEEVTNEKDETDTVIRILHIYLDERDLREVRRGTTFSLTALQNPVCSTTSPSESTRCCYTYAVAAGSTRTAVTSSSRACPWWQKGPATL